MVMVGKPIHKFCMRSAFISVARISTGFSYIFFLKGSWSSHFSLNISPGIIQISSVREARTLHRQVEKVSLFFSCAGSIASFYFYFFFRNNKFPSHGETHSILFCVLFHNEKKTESHQLISPFTCNASQQQQVCVCARAASFYATLLRWRFVITDGTAADPFRDKFIFECFISLCLEVEASWYWYIFRVESTTDWLISNSCGGTRSRLIWIVCEAPTRLSQQMRRYAGRRTANDGRI